MKTLIFDSGPLINLSMNGLLDILEKLKKNFKGKFYITQEVKHEIYDTPINIQRFELGAIKMKELIDKKIIEVFPSDKQLEEKTNYFLDKANHTIMIDGHWINIVSKAEMSCLALSKMLESQGHQTIIAVDERTTRVLCEKPDNLAKIMEQKLHKNVKLDPIKKDIFKGFNLIRSSEIVYSAFKLGLTGTDKKMLEAMLYATKYKGAAVSFEEIAVMKKI